MESSTAAAIAERCSRSRPRSRFNEGQKVIGFCAGEPAVAAAEASLQERPGYLYAHVVRVGALARLGRVREARHALAELLARRPHVSARDIEWLPYDDRRWNRHLLDGLALAGFHVHGIGPVPRLRA